MENLHDSPESPSVSSNGHSLAAPSTAKERPILFSAPMVHALLDGRKTQTRRAMKNQPPREEDFFGSSFGLDRAVADGVKMYSQNDYDRLPKHPTDWQLLGSVGVARGAGFPDRYRCPHGGPGDRLWVRERFAPLAGSRTLPDGRWTVSGNAEPIRTADYSMTVDGAHKHRDGRYTPGLAEYAEGAFSGVCWAPSIHMPRWASRITLEITGVRVERLQDISTADAIAEGLYKSYPDDDDREWFRTHRADEGHEPTLEEWEQFEAGVWMVPGVPQGWGMTPAQRQHDTWAPTPEFAYRLLWEHINGPGSWDANPWVWVVEFRRASERLGEPHGNSGTPTNTSTHTGDQPL